MVTILQRANSKFPTTGQLFGRATQYDLTYFNSIERMNLARTFTTMIGAIQAQQQ